jgi:hypothetical protein
MMIYVNDVCIVNIYAPSGNARSAEREEFYNTEIIELLPIRPSKLLLQEISIALLTTVRVPANAHTAEH